MARPAKPLIERLGDAFTFDPDGCWRWARAIRSDGYAEIKAPGTRYAHRAVYQLVVGPIPKGLQLDHLCRVRHCVNPTHLEPVTLGENLRRGKALITRCPQDHPYDEDNTYRTSDGKRMCRTCARERMRRRRAA